MRGRRDRPRRPERQRRPHLARAPVPVADRGPQAPAGRRRARCPSGCACIPEYIDPEWISRPVLDVIKTRVLVVHPAARLGPPGRRSSVGDDVAPRAVERGRDGLALTPEELTALFAETPARGDRGHALRGRRAAVRAGGRHGHVRGQPQHQRLEHLHRRLRVLRVRAVAPLARRVRALRGGVRASASRRRSSSAPPRSASSPGSIPTGGSRTTRSGCGSPRTIAPELHLHAYSPMEVAHMCDVSGLSPAARVRAAARGRPRLDAGHRRRGAARRRPRADLAQQAAGGALGRDHRGVARGGASARP